MHELGRTGLRSYTSFINYMIAKVTVNRHITAQRIPVLHRLTAQVNIHQ